MARSLRFVFLVAVFALAISPVASALAAPAAWQSVDVTLYPEQSGSTLLVAGELPASVPLPATAELSVPAGSQVQWLGQVLGGESSADPTLEYTKSTVGASDVYRFTLTKSRVAQIEVPAATAVPFDGTTYRPSITWTAAQPIPEVDVRVRVPQGAQIAQQVQGATLQAGTSGYGGYTKTYKNVKPGDKLDLAFAYTVPAVAKTTVEASSSAGSLLVPAILVVIVAIVGVLLVMSVRRKLATKSGNSITTPASEEATRLNGTTKRNLVTAGVIVSMLALAVVLGAQSTKAKSTGDTISKTFSQGAPCASATIEVARAEGTDPATTADTLFKALDGIDGMNTGTYNSRTSSIEVGWCESKTTEAAVRQALASTGLVAQAPATAP